MLVTLGPRPVAGDLIDRLLDCHRRIRWFATMAVRLTSFEPTSPDQIRTTAQAVRRYLTEGLPLHVADEDFSIAPRVRGHDHATDDACERAAVEHAELEPLVAAVVAACTMLEADPGRIDAIAPDLAPVATRLHAALVAHLDHEERHLFPAIRALGAGAHAQIVREMRGRRAAPASRADRRERPTRPLQIHR